MCAARKTSNYFRMQISGFSADFFLLPATRQQHRPPSNIPILRPSSSLLPHPSWQSDFFVSTPKWQHWLPDRQTDRRAGEPQITDTAFDRQQIYLNDMQIKLTSTKFRYFSFRFGALFSLCLLHSQRRRGRAECGEREGGGWQKNYISK